jgi:hypothetical protein
MAALFLLTPVLMLPAIVLLGRFEQRTLRGEGRRHDTR